LLVRGDDGRSRAQQLEDVPSRRLDAAHDLGDDLDRGVISDSREVRHEHAVSRREGAPARGVPHEGADDAQTVAGRTLDVVGVLDEQTIDCGADRPVAEKADADVARQSSPPPSRGA
jgi:hypothetical protein